MQISPLTQPRFGALILEKDWMQGAKQRPFNPEEDMTAEDIENVQGNREKAYTTWENWMTDSSNPLGDTFQALETNLGLDVLVEKKLPKQKRLELYPDRVVIKLVKKADQTVVSMCDFALVNSLTGEPTGSNSFKQALSWALQGLITGLIQNIEKI